MDIEELVRKKFLDSAGRLTYDELVESFKENFINDEQFKTDFKKAVNRLATVKHEQDRKYLVLKPKYQHNQKKMFPDGLKSSILEALKSDDTTTRQQNVSSTLSDFDLILDSLEFSINNNNAPVVTSPIPEITVTDNSANIEERLTDDSVIASVIQEATEDKSEDVHVQHKVVNTDRNVKASCESIESQSSSSGTANRSRLNSSEENVSVNSISLGEDELKWILASALSDLARIKNLLSKNADLANYVDFTNGYTALHYAAKNGVLVVVQLLMTVGKMDVDRKSNSALMFLSVPVQIE
uniref:SOWAHA-C winged helix-turn-helix domain-containing protein n=1 Tax=Romanomermis culicivorax TaxID=13658 RepID=A0A915KLP3_ROMCU